MNVINKFLDEVFLVETNCFEDHRGAFIKIFNTDNSLTSDYIIRQVNYVVSVPTYTLRGLHYQKGAFAEAKIFKVMNGSAQIAFVDVRQNSLHYLQSGTVVLNSPRQSVIIPRGFATGYCTLTENTAMLYLSDNQYAPEAESGLLWNDPKLKINWLENHPVLSEKDRGWLPV